jgi:hypothetical protein
MVGIIPSGASLLKISNINIRLREVLVLFLIWSVLLNLFLVSRLQTVESGHSLHSIHSDSQRSAQLDSYHQNRDISQQKQPSKKQRDDGALLKCESYGGPSNRAAIDDIVYWRADPPLHKQFHSIYEEKNGETEKFFIYEPDDAGFSNVRITFETVVAVAKATGRTLVLAPKMIFHQLYFNHPEGWRSYAFTDFFDISGIPTIPMETYLKRFAMTGKIHNATGEVSFPPENRTNWDVGTSEAGNRKNSLPLFTWLSESLVSIDWNRDKCIIPFPSEHDVGETKLNEAMRDLLNDKNDTDLTRIQSFAGNPIPVNSSMKDRLRESLANRRKFCYYNETFQNAQSIYMDGHEYTGIRPLIQFFAYTFFESWEQDLQMKRFIRDHLRFSDIIQCAAARIVNAIREIAKNAGGDGNNMEGGFDTMHIRRGDFKGLAYYKDGIVEPNDIVTAKYFKPQRTIYIATDETDIAFFEPLRQHHTVLFLNDFHHLIADIDPNYYGMIEQLVCAKGDKFVGTYYSTFSAYINRVRGYHAQKSQSSQAKQGSLNSEYMGHKGQYRKVMRVCLQSLRVALFF